MKKFEIFDLSTLKPGYNVINERQYFVFPENFGGEKAHDLFMERMQISPFMAANAGAVETSAVDLYFANIGNDEGTKFTCEQMKLLQAGPCIFAEERFLKKMEAVDFLSILAHEEGHIQYGHLDGGYQEDQLVEVNGLKIVVNTAIELEADSFAALTFAKEVVAKAVLATHQLMVREVGHHFEFSQERIERKVKCLGEVAVLRERIEALGGGYLLNN